MDNNEAPIEQVSKTQQKFTSLVEWGPTPRGVVKKMLELAQVGSEDIVYDLGCGDARILMMAVKEFGVRKAVGYEIKKQNLQNRIALIRDDLLNADLSEASVITLFLSITANEHLRHKLEREAKPSTRIVSYVHPMKRWLANSTELRPADRLYSYVVPRAFQIMPD